MALDFGGSNLFERQPEERQVRVGNRETADYLNNFFWGTSGSDILVDGFDYFYGISGISVKSEIQTAFNFTMPYDGMITKFTVDIGTNTENENVNVRLFKSSVSPGVGSNLVTFGAGITGKQVNTTATTFLQGDRFSVEIYTDGAGTISNIFWTIEIEQNL